jgi:hypothetical protein
MIIKNAEDLNGFLEKLQNHVSKKGNPVELDSLEKIFSKSEGFNTKADLELNLPIYIDCGGEASRELVDQLKKSELANQLGSLGERTLLRQVADCHNPFPICAQPGCNLYLFIDWRYEDISIPFQDDTSSPSSGEEYYRHTTRFKLPHCVYEVEYIDLCEQLRPLVARVASGYTNNGEEADATFNSDAEYTIAKIEELICSLNFEVSFTEGICPEEILFSDLPSIDDVYRENLTIVKSNNELILDHSFTDIDLKKMVAKYALDFGIAFNCFELFDHFKNLRDACKDICEALTS